MGSYYARNHLQDDWDLPDTSAEENRQRAYNEAFQFFRSVPTSRESFALLNETADWLEVHGELSEDLDARWTALSQQQVLEAAG